jgi:hypothetical protein
MSVLDKLSLDEIRCLRGSSYNIAIKYLREIKSDDDNIKKMRLLIGQFSYGIEAQNELLELCIEMGLIKGVSC